LVYVAASVFVVPLARRITELRNYPVVREGVEPVHLRIEIIVLPLLMDVGLL
jgi:hypothetical protein